jgi:hypothetical protein
MLDAERADVNDDEEEEEELEEELEGEFAVELERELEEELVVELAAEPDEELAVELEGELEEELVVELAAELDEELAVELERVLEDEPLSRSRRSLPRSPFFFSLAVLIVLPPALDMSNVGSSMFASPAPPAFPTPLPFEADDVERVRRVLALGVVKPTSASSPGTMGVVS